MKFELSHDRWNITDQDLISDMRRVAHTYPNSRFTQTVYRQHGKYSFKTIINRFGTWNAGVAAADLEIVQKKNISERELFEALSELWIRLGRQPKYTELSKPLFPYSAKPYEQRFGSWRKALEAFVAYANSEELEDLLAHHESKHASPRRTPRSVNLRLRLTERGVRRGDACPARSISD